MRKKIIFFLVLLLVIIHKDFWLWDNAYLLFGFLPIGLAYHIGLSITASIVWALASFYAWPHEWESFASEEHS